MELIFALRRVFLCHNSLSLSRRTFTEDAVRNLKKIPESHYTVRFDRRCVERAPTTKSRIMSWEKAFRMHLLPLYSNCHFIYIKDTLSCSEILRRVALHEIANVNIFSNSLANNNQFFLPPSSPPHDDTTVNWRRTPITVRKALIFHRLSITYTVPNAGKTRRAKIGETLLTGELTPRSEASIDRGIN